MASESVSGRSWALGFTVLSTELCIVLSSTHFIHVHSMNRPGSAAFFQVNATNPHSNSLWRECPKWSPNYCSPLASLLQALSAKILFHVVSCSLKRVTRYVPKMFSDTSTYNLLITCGFSQACQGLRQVVMQPIGAFQWPEVLRVMQRPSLLLDDWPI
jgi:hypothetical protein